VPQSLVIAIVCWAAGLASLGGAVVARWFGIRGSEVAEEVTHGIVAFGGGILFAAVALALVPEGMSLLPLWLAVPIFFAGALLFMVADERLSLTGRPRSQLMAMLLDFVPEAVSFGAVFPHNPRLGILLAAFIGAQNLPEGFAAYREMIGAGAPPGQVLRRMLYVSLLGPAAGLCGYYLLRSSPALVGALMLLASGGILYLVFQDVAPQARMRRHWAPTLGAALGFIVGMVGERILN